MKTLCDYSKKLPENLQLFIDQARVAAFVCGKCGRVAGTKEMVCKPKKIDRED